MAFSDIVPGLSVLCRREKHSPSLLYDCLLLFIALAACFSTFVVLINIIEQMCALMLVWDRAGLMRRTGNGRTHDPANTKRMRSAVLDIES